MCMTSVSSGYLKAVFLLFVHRAHAGDGCDELPRGERFTHLLTNPPLCEHIFDHFHYVSLGEAISDLGQAADVQGFRKDPSSALDDLFPENCCIQHGRKDTGLLRVIAEQATLAWSPAPAQERDASGVY